ncbi:four helix bundle protein [Joostella atrarenae]|uniref:Four helix bundle protein n=1 Tax=Joostella atrarenae TaxID=679257 RepID=A0ABS9IZU0_9FLAO|nr:four helix bundle protein [Joostella atrarenae]MCF8713690.1 four helix bundle protein [Joostella atrarenae]
MGSTTFEDLEVYKLTLLFTINIFDLLNEKQLEKEFSIKDQLKRATLSISNNIAEGFERETDKELIRFLYFSKGSSGEVRNILNILKETNYINEDKWLSLRSEVIVISKQLSNYIKYIKRR